MFINIVEFPSIKKGKDEEFKEWFSWSNSVFEKFDGFISRRLLKPTKGDGNYVAIVEHETEKSFMAMHLSEERKKAREKLELLLKLLTDTVKEGIDENFRNAMSKKNFDKDNVNAGREYVESYVTFIHYVERLFEAAERPVKGHYHESD